MFDMTITILGYAPPGSRSEKLTSDTVNIPSNLICSHAEIPSSDGIVVSTLVAEERNPSVPKTAPHWVMLYLQGFD